MGDAVAVAEKSGKFLLFNPAAKRILGIEAVETTPENRAEQCGIFLRDQITLCPASELPLARAIRGINISSEELFVRHAKLPEGAWVSCTARPLRAPVRQITTASRLVACHRISRDENARGPHSWRSSSSIRGPSSRHNAASNTMALTDGAISVW